MFVLSRFFLRGVLLMGLSSLLTACPSLAPKTHSPTLYYPTDPRVCPDGVRVTASGFDFGPYYVYTLDGGETFKEERVPVDSTNPTSYVMTKPAIAPATPEDALTARWNGFYRHMVRGEVSGSYSFQCLGAPGRELLNGPNMSGGLYGFILVEDATAPSGLKLIPRLF